MSEQSYFTGAESGEAAGQATWIDLDRDMQPQEILPGLFFRPVVGTNLAINLVQFEPNTVAPRHGHVEEQVVLVLDGEVEFEVEGETHLLGPHSVLVIPPWAQHAARTYDQPCTCVDAFSPPRQGLAEVMRRAQEQKREDSHPGDNDSR